MWHPADGNPTQPAFNHNTLGCTTSAICPCFLPPLKSGSERDRPYGTFSVEYDGMGRLTWLNNSVHYNPDDWYYDYAIRRTVLSYDELGRPQTHFSRTGESGWGSSGSSISSTTIPWGCTRSTVRTGWGRR